MIIDMKSIFSSPYLYAIALSFFVLGSVGVAQAEITFSPASPVVTGSNTIPSCSVGDTIVVFNSDGSFSYGALCGLEVTRPAGTYTYIECDSSLDNMCTSFASLSMDYYLSSPGYISTNTFTWTEPISSVGGCMDPLALNYNASATFDDGSCHYTTRGASLSSVISTASSTFERSYGFGFSNIKDFYWKIMSFIMGSGLGLLILLIQYITALIFISATIYIVYRVFMILRK